MSQGRTYGTVSLGKNKWHADRKEWRITCEPHVALRLKRIFERVSKADFGTLLLSDTPETAAEILWAIERYPMVVENMRYLRKRAREYNQTLERTRGLMDGHVPPPACEMAIPPRDYQRLAAGMVLNNGSLLLADELGTGKSCSAICTFTDPRTLPALVVTKTHLTTQWKNEIAKFLPSLSVHITKTGSAYDMTRGPRGKKLQQPDVIVTNYAKLHGWSDELAGHVKSVVFDEIDELHTGNGAKYKAAVHVARAAKFRMGLTGTPINNYGGEIFNVMDVLQEGCLGTSEEFHREWCRHVGYGTNERALLKEPRVFGGYLREQGIFLRRTKADVGRELPPLTVVEQEVDTDYAAIEAVSDRASELAKIILGQSGFAKGEKFRAAEELSYRLRQATGIAKAPYVADFVRMLVESGEPTLLFGWHRAVYDLWAERLKDLNPVFYTGEETTREKEEAKRKFVSGETKLMVISLRSGAGLDGLQAVCRNVVYGELDWSPAIMEQCAGRVFRDGQLLPVFLYLLTANHGSDPIMVDVLGLKRLQSDGIKNPHADVIEELQVDPNKISRLAESFLKQRDDRAA